MNQLITSVNETHANVANAAAAAIRRFDGALHGSMTRAKKKEDWLGILAQILIAHVDGELRPNVRKRFESECPHRDIVFRWQRETGTLPKPERHVDLRIEDFGSIVRKGKPASEVARKKARAEKERDRRSKLINRSGGKQK